MEPKGIITGYEIRYSSGHTVSLNSNNPYYKTTDGEQVPELTVQVIVIIVGCYHTLSIIFNAVAL